MLRRLHFRKLQKVWDSARISLIHEIAVWGKFLTQRVASFAYSSTVGLVLATYGNELCVFDAQTIYGPCDPRPRLPHVCRLGKMRPCGQYRGGPLTLAGASPFHTTFNWSKSFIAGSGCVALLYLIHTLFGNFKIRFIITYSKTNSWIVLYIRYGGSVYSFVYV